MLTKINTNHKLIIENPLFLAPMAGITDKPYRKVISSFSKIPMITEMVSSHSLVQSYKSLKTSSHRNIDKYNDESMTGVQLFGSNPKIMAEAAKIIEDNGAKWIDINMGCPVPKVATRAKAGAFLMLDHKLAEQIMTSITNNVSIPVSIKTRLGWDESHLNADKLVKIAYNSGISWVMIHGRTKTMGYSGKARWSEINTIAKNNQIHIIGNGDIVDIKTYQEKLKFNDVKGVAVGRGILGKPWLFKELLENKTYQPNILETILYHLDLTLDYYGISAGILLFRKHLCWYSNGIENSSNFRQKINSITDKNQLITEINNFFKGL